jgi:hypothetical protein
MTAEEVSSGLVLPYVVQAVSGKAGAAALLVTIFMVRQIEITTIRANSHTVGLHIHCLSADDCNQFHH